MAIEITEQRDPSSQDMNELWPRLSPRHQQMILDLTRELVSLDQPASGDEKSAAEQIWRAEQRERNAGAIALLQSWADEDAKATPEELARGEAELEEFKQRLNANRAPEPPLFT